MADFNAIFKRELLEAPTEEMHKYLAHFGKETDVFIDGLSKAARAWELYQQQAVLHERTHEQLVWSGAYFLNSINSALASTRLFLSGYLVPSGNQVRFSIESIAFAVLLAFPGTGTYSEWKAGHMIEHKAVERLRRNADKCGVKEESVGKLLEYSKWYDAYSHPSRVSLASVWYPKTEGPWMVGGFFAEEHLDQYKKEMTGRVDIAGLLLNAIAGTHARLIETKVLPKARAAS